MIHKVVMLGLASGLAVSALAQGPGQRPGRPHAALASAKARKSAAAQPAMPTPPVAVQAPPEVVAPPRPEQMTPVAPQVTYQNGQLSIQAQNSTLSAILTAVHARTGARVEMPADTANDRAAVQLGPGNPRDVLGALLQGSRFDYIVIGSPTDPDELAEVILTPHAGSGGAAPGNAAANQLPGVSSRQLTMPRIASPPEINGDEEETAAEPQPVYQPPQPGVAGPEQPGQQPTMAVTPGVEPGQAEKPNEVKTPEQLLKQLQRMQQQQQGRRQPQQE